MVLTLTKINKSAAEQYTSNLAKKKKNWAQLSQMKAKVKNQL